MINVSDTLYLQYNSSWLALNLTLFYLEGTTSSQWQYLNVQENPILNAGTNNFDTIKISISPSPSTL